MYFHHLSTISFLCWYSRYRFHKSNCVFVVCVPKHAEVQMNWQYPTWSIFLRVSSWGKSHITSNSANNGIDFLCWCVVLSPWIPLSSPPLLCPQLSNLHFFNLSWGLSPDGVIMPADRACVSHPGIFALRQRGGCDDRVNLGLTATCFGSIDVSCGIFEIRVTWGVNNDEYVQNT